MRKINKIILCMVTILATTSFALAGTVSDRDGYKYKTVKIGKQHWMAEDYRFETKFSKCADYRGVDPDGCIREYDFLSTIDAGVNICPTGWRLPTEKDFIEMTHFVTSDIIMANDATEKQIRKRYAELTNRLSSTSCKEGKNSVGFNASCGFDNVSPVYYGVITGGKNRNVGETAFGCVEISRLGVFDRCPKGGWAVYLRVRCIEE